MALLNLRAALATSVAITAIALPQAALAQERSFNVPAQTAVTGINELARQADIQILVSESATKGKRTKAVKGRMTVKKALAKLLSGTGLKVASSDGRTFTLKPGSAPTIHPTQINSTSPRAGEAKNASSSGEESTASSRADGEYPAEIIVTAQKRNERLLDVPTAITVLSGERLAQLNVNSIADMEGYVPGLTVISGGTPGSRQIVLRGINSSFYAITTPALVGTYIDDMPVGTSSAFGSGGLYGVDLSPHDVEAVEILKGPQGTLYGSNTMGGLLKYTLKKPSLTEIEAQAGGDVQSIAHSDGFGWSVRASLSAPIIVDRLAVRVSGFYKDNEGWLDNVLLGDKDANSSTQKGGLISILWKPTDTLTLRSNILSQRIRANNISEVNLTSDGQQPIYGAYAFASNFPDSFRMDNDNYYVGIDWDTGFATLTSSSGWSTIDSAQTRDLTKTFGPFCAPFPVFELNGCPDYQNGDALALFTAAGKVTKFVQELRLTSPQRQRFQWMLGGYYTKEHVNYLETMPSYLPDRTPLPARNTFLEALVLSEYSERAVFANATYQFSDAFDATAGIRYSRFKTDLNQHAVTGVFGGSAAVNSSTPSVGITTWMGNIRYRPTADMMIYARVANGYRPGKGCNTDNAGNPCGFPTLGIPGLVEPDRTTNYEVGLKGQFLDRRLTIDLSAFWIDWTNIQINQINPVNNINYAGNGGTATSKGFELGTQFRISDDLILNGVLAFTDAKITEDVPGAGGLDGDRLPGSAKWTASVGLDYERPVSATANLLAGASYRYRSRVYNQFQSSARPYPTRPHNIVDAYAGVEIDKLTVRLSARNLLNNRTYNGLLYVADVSEPLYVPVQPRTFVLSADIRF